MFYRYPRDSAQSLMVRTGYALLSGHLTANGTLQKKKPAETGWLFCFPAGYLNLCVPRATLLAIEG